MSLQSRYTIVRKIADGGTAEIFLAKQHGAHGFEKSVVMKRIFTAFYADPAFRHMLVDEAHIAMTLSHSNIVQVLDLGEVDGRYFLALELVDGWTLDRTLKRAQAAGVPFPPALALYVTAEICRALAYAHGKVRDGKPLGIVHRDVSPHNVLLSAEGEVKLTDFGIAKAQNRKEQSLGNLIKGKISFMSPEQASGGQLDGRSDLFSLGTMLYAMITRRLPFDAPTDYETLMLVKSGDYLPPETARPGLNPELYRVIRKAMGKMPGDRYQKAEEMLVDVEQVMRLAFRPVGQTELQRWLADLSSKDGIPPLTREPPPPTARDTVVDTRGAKRPADAKRTAAGTGTDSGLVLDLDDAVEVTPGSPPPPPSAVKPAAAAYPNAGPTEVMKHPPDMGADSAPVESVLPWYRRRGGMIIGALALGLMLVVSAKLFSGHKPASAGTPSAPVAVAPPEPVAPPPAPPPPAVAPAAEPEKAPPPVAAAPEPAKPAAEPTGAPAVAEKAKESDDEAAEQPKEEEPAAAADPAKPRKATPTLVAVTFRSEPEGARVATKNHVYGTTPQAAKLAPGTAYELTFTKSGYAPAAKRYVAPAAKGPVTLKVSLKKLPEPKKPAPPSPPPARKGWWFQR